MCFKIVSLFRLYINLFIFTWFLTRVLATFKTRIIRLQGLQHVKEASFPD